MEEFKHIMIIDDDHDDREFFQQALLDVNPGITTITAEDGVDALELLNLPGVRLPDYIFLDLNMPRMNGIQCLILLKKSERLKQIPVAVYSTTRRGEEEKAIKALGAVHFFTKPTSLEKICACIVHAFSHST